MELSPQESRVCQSRQKGFNLIDLLIVVAIVCITAGMGLPSLQALLSETRATTYITALSRDIMYMRTYAINQGHAVTICPLEGSKCIKDWSKNLHVFIDDDMNRVRATNEQIIKVIDDPKVGDYFEYPRIGITFRSDGSINGFQSGTFRYCPDTKDSLLSVGLTINQAGRSRIRTQGIRCKGRL